MYNILYTVSTQQYITVLTYCCVKQSSPITGLDRPRGFQEVKVPRFRDKDDGKVVILTHRPPLPPGNIPGTHFC